MNNLNEIWRDIPDYPNYQISNLGNVRNIKFGRIIKPGINKCGYLHVSLYNNYGQKTFDIHRLVANAFIPNSNNYPQVNHKDEDKQNNCVNNLEWCSAQYNTEYSKAKQVLQFDLNGNYITTWKSTHEIERQLGIDQANISRCCLGLQNSSYNFIWKYL